MALIQAFFGDLFACRPKDVSTCCSCKDDKEILTKAWIDSLEQVSVLSEVGANHTAVQPVSVDHSKSPTQQEDGKSPVSGPDSQGTLPLKGGLDKLRVPAEFDGARSGVLRSISREPTVVTPGSSNSAEDQRRCLQTSLRAFTKSLLHGISVSVLLDDGRTRLAEARLDSELTHLVLHVPNAQHPVALTCIESVSTPDEAWASSPNAEMPAQAYIDERCATLVISGGQFLTFVFDAPRTREYFEMCLKILILAKESSGSPSCQKGDRCGTGRTLGGASPCVEPGAGVVPPARPGSGVSLPPVPGLGTVPEQASEAESDEWAQQTGSPLSQNTVVSRT